MNRKTQIIRTVIFAAMGLAIAASAVCVLSGGMGLSADMMTVGAFALTAAVLTGLCAWSGPVAVVSGVMLALGLGAAVFMLPGGMEAIKALIALRQGVQADPALLEQGGKLMSVLGAYVMGAVFTGLVSRKEFASVGIIIYLGLIVIGYSLSESIGLWPAVPGLVAAVAAFGLSAGPQRDGSGVRVLIPAVLAVMLAFVLLPGEGTVWRPLERAAERVREVFEQYFNFSSERIAFSINEQGYDHAGMIGEDVVAMLGGPANPDTEPVMSVTADEDVLLRGAIRTAYTGYSWIDDTVKNRYLYYDVTHSNVRDRVFGRDFGSD